MVASKNSLKTPIMAALMEDRRLGWAVMGAVALQGSLIILGLPGWPCPFRHTLGIPCPGCGLSRAMAALFRGDWETAWDFHAFAPLILVGLVVIMSASLLPQRQRLWLTGQVERIERRSGVTVMALIALIGYWLVRLLLFSDTYVKLIIG